MFAKFALKSKTVWFNVVTLIMLVAVAFGYEPEAVNPVFVDTALGILVLVAPIVNMLLRAVTDKPITFKPERGRDTI